MTTKNEIVLIYEMTQIETVVSYVRARKTTPTVISLNFWAERELVKRGIAVSPLTDYYKTWADFGDLLARMEDVAREWYRLPEMSFFQHKGLSIGEMIEGMLCNYLQTVQYYLFIYERIFSKHPDVTCVTIPYSVKEVYKTSGPLAPFQVQMVVAVGEFFAAQKGILCKPIGATHEAHIDVFPGVSFWRTLFLRIYNACIRLFAPRRTLRLFVSDYWKNIEPFIRNMDDVELVFVERKELRNIPLHQLWKHRIRFMHPLDALSSRIRSIARARLEEFKKTWPGAREAITSLQGFTYGAYNWWPLVEPTFDFFVTAYAERIVADIESVQTILEKEHINRVLVRAGISGQHHFYIMGKLPHQLGIPSFEIQHGIGIGIMDPNSIFARLIADYIAAYGPFVQRAFMRNGYTQERILLAGSPRFDRYIGLRDAPVFSSERSQILASKGLDSRKPIVFVVVPEEYIELTPYAISSYEFRDFLIALRDIRKEVPDLQYMLKFRSQTQLEFYRAYIQELFPEGSIAMEFGDAFPLLLLCDFVYSGFSTLVSECIMGRKPVVLSFLKKGDTYFYEAHKDGIISVPLLDETSGIPVKEIVKVTRELITNKAFYADAVKKGERYLAENFTLTGDAAQRVANILHAGHK